MHPYRMTCMMRQALHVMDKLRSNVGYNATLNQLDSTACEEPDLGSSVGILFASHKELCHCPGLGICQCHGHAIALLVPASTHILGSADGPTVH